MITPEHTVFIIEDDPSVRQSLVELVGVADLRTRAYGCAREFLAAFDPEAGGCIVLDVCLPDLTGLDVLSELNARKSSLPILMISGQSDIPIAVEALHRGAFDFLEKPFSPQQLLHRIQEALGEHERRRKLDAREQDVAARFARLTHREREVVDLVVQGLNNRQIAMRFNVSSQAVDAHRKRAMQKLGVSTVADMVRLSISAGKEPAPVAIAAESGSDAAVR